MINLYQLYTVVNCKYLQKGVVGVMKKDQRQKKIFIGMLFVVLLSFGFLGVEKSNAAVVGNVSNITSSSVIQDDNKQSKFSEQITNDTQINSVEVHTITFDMGITGVANPAPIQAAKGTKVTMPAATASRAGYNFLGWEDGSNNVYVVSEQYTMTDKDVTFKAKWELKVTL